MSATEAIVMHVHIVWLGVIIGLVVLTFAAALIVFRVPISSWMAKFPVSSPRTPGASIGAGILFGCAGLIFIVGSLFH